MHDRTAYSRILRTFTAGDRPLVITSPESSPTSSTIHNTPSELEHATSPDAGGFSYPVDNMQTGGWYGYARQVPLPTASSCLGIPAGTSAFHAGQDINAQAGTRVDAVGNGTVVFAQFMNYPGYVIIVEHTLASGSRIWSMYGHIKRPAVIVGDSVTSDTKIAEVDDYARAPSNRHLHWEMRYFPDGRTICAGTAGRSRVLDAGPGYTNQHPDTHNYTDPIAFVDTYAGTCLAQSAHPYSNNFNNTWTITNPDTSATVSRIQFSRIALEDACNCDRIEIMDASDRIYDSTYDSWPNGAYSEPVPGRTVKVRLVTDSSVTAWGFCVDSVGTVSRSGGGSPPAAPTNLRATAISSTQIRLDWNDNADNESGFGISGAGLSNVRVGAGVTSYTVGGLAPEADTPFYNVFAYNSFGNSAPTSWVRTRTLAPSAGNTCNPAANAIVLYEHLHAGRCWSFTQDHANFNDIGANDTVSSIQFRGTYASGWEAQLYEHTGFTGASSVFRVENWDFQNTTVGNDRASSIRIRRAAASDTDDGRTIANGQTLYGSIDPSNDEDTYYFDISGGQTATIRMNKNGSSLDSYLVLYSPGGSQITLSDDEGGNQNALINQWYLPQGGRYRLVAKSYLALSSGAYTLNLSLSTMPTEQPPSAPSNLRVTVLDSSRFQLTWSDNSNNESGFRVFDGGSSPIATVGSGVTSLTPGGYASGTYKCFSVRAYNGAGEAGTGMVCDTTRVAGPSSCPGQYRAEYFNSRTLSGSPSYVRCEGWPINQNWGQGGPGNGISNDNFSARWTGRANIAAGTYNFIARSDDGVRVWIDNSLIIDEWRDRGPTENSVSRSISGGDHDIKVEYYEKDGGAVAQFRWEQGSSGGGGGGACGGATSISLGQTVDGSLSGSSRWYCFTGVSGNWVSIRVFKNNSSSSLDPMVKLFRGTVLLGDNDDEDGIVADKHSFLVRQLPMTTVYRVEVSPCCSTSGGFKLRIDSGRKASAADVNMDCTVNSVDNSRVIANYGGNEPHADINLDGTINALDLSLVSPMLGRSCP